MLGSEGASAKAPIASDWASSKIASQVVPPFSERQTPPCAVPRYTLFALLGSTTTAVTRPLTAVLGPESGCPLAIVAGPIGVQAAFVVDGGGAPPLTINSRRRPCSCRSIC